MLVNRLKLTLSLNGSKWSPRQHWVFNQYAEVSQNGRQWQIPMFTVQGFTFQIG